MTRAIGLLALFVVLVGLHASSSQAFDAEGQFSYVLDGAVVAEENFTFTTTEAGNTRLESTFILLSEEFLLQFETDRLFDQTLELTPDLSLLSYTLASDTAQGKFNVEVSVKDGVANLSFSTFNADDEQTRSGQQDVLLEDDVVASGISGSGSQLTLLQAILLKRNITQKTTLLALNPSDLFNPLVEVVVEPLSELNVTAGGQTFPVQRFSVSQLLQGSDGDPFTVELLSRDGKMIAYRALSQTSALLVYRSDLFPDGIEVDG